MFAELPIKLKERKGSSQSIPASRKRPSPGDKATAHRGYQSVPDVSQRPQHDSALGSSQGSPFSDQNAVPGPMQPTSMPSPSGLHPAVAGSPQLQSGQWKSVSADHTSSSGGEMSSQPMPFAQPLANNLLDLRGLMYPSTNPFAYGNQPLSILEDHQMMTAGQQSSFVGPTSNAFGTSINSAHAPEMSFEIFNNPMFRNLPQHGAFQPVQYGSTSSSRPHLSHIQMPQSNLDDGIWQEMTKGRTGLTPGVNLDELFGSDGGWNPGYLDQGYGKL